MKEEFINASGIALVFTDDGIICRGNLKSCFYPYGCITKINYSLGSFLVAGKREDGDIEASSFIPSQKEHKKRIKELIDIAKEKMKNSAPDVVSYIQG